MMFIRPTIIRTAEDGRSVTRGRFDHLIKRDLSGTDDSTFMAPRLKSFFPEGESMNPNENKLPPK